jgi:hypothetical protein
MAITTKTPVRTVFDASNAAVGLAEFQTDEVVSITHGGTSGNSISSAKLALSLTDSNIRSLLSVSGSGSYDNSTGIITVTGGVTSVGGATGTVSNAQVAAAITATGTFATLASPTFTGTPLAPTAVAGTSNTMIATTAFVTTAVTNLIDSAPGALDTLNELAAAINDDNNFATTIVTQLGNKANTVSLTTANVTELTNLYFTNARVFSAVTGNLALKANVIDLTTANVSELTNLYFTNARVFSAVSGNLALKSNVVDLTTANVTELTNLYFTNARSRAAISVGSGGSYDNSTGIITITGGFVVSSVTVFPGHSGNVDYGDLTTLTVDAFGVATGTAYDCMEPIGSLVSEDLEVL